MSKRGFAWIVGLVCVFGQFAARAAASTPPLIPGDLLVLNSQNSDGGGGQIIEIDPTTGHEAVWESGGYLEQPTRMVFDGLGNLIVSDYDNGIIRINTSTGQQTQVAAGNYLVGTSAVAIDNAGNYIAFGTPNGYQFPQSVNAVRVDPVTGTQTLLASAVSDGPGGYTSLSGPVDAVVGPDGSVFVSNADLGGFNDGLNGILKLDPTSGDISVVSTGNIFFGEMPGGIMLDPENPQNLWAVCTGSTSLLLDVNIVTGAQRVISSGGLLQQSGPIAEEGDGDPLVANSMYLSSDSFLYLPSTIVSIDPATGSQTLVFAESTGGDLTYPKAILVIPEPASAAILFGCALLAIRRRSPRNS